MTLQSRTGKRTINSRQANEHGWALLGLLLALGVMSIVLASSIVPNVQMQVQRDKELEMIYRGEQISQGIARYYNNGSLGGIRLLRRPNYGYLLDLTKLRDGVTIGINERKFVRPSALIDPIANADWEPVRARDSRIMPFLQAWAAQTLLPIPNDYLLLAGPPTKSVFSELRPSDPPSGTPAPGQASPAPPIINPANPGNPPARPPENPDDPNSDLDNIVDPLAHLFDSDAPGKSNAPIVGVVSKRKGKAANAYFGLEHYEEWIFIFLPTTPQQGLGVPPPNPLNPPNPGQQIIRPPQISQ